MTYLEVSEPDLSISQTKGENVVDERFALWVTLRRAERLCQHLLH
jgi:hypothetical protein